MQMSLTVEERLDRIEQLLRGQKNVLNFSEACDFTGISPSYMYNSQTTSEIAARIGPTGPKPIGAAGLSTPKKAHRSP